MLSREQYQRISIALEQSLKRTCELCRFAYAALNKWANSESGRLFLKAIEMEKKIRGENANR